MMRVLFLDNINLCGLVTHIFLSRGYDRVYYFNITRSAGTLLRYSFLRRNIEHYDFRMSKLSDEKGEALYPRIFGIDLLNVCDRIENDIFRNSPFIERLGKLFDREKILIFFRKLAGKDISRNIVFINVIEYYRRHLKETPVFIEFSIEENPFFDSLKEFARQSYDIRIVKRLSLKKRAKILGLLCKNIISVTATFFASSLSRVRGVSKSRKESFSRVAIPYRYYGVTFSSEERCDFPWLLFSGIPLRQAIICFDSRHGAATDSIVATLRSRGDIGYIAMCREAAESKDIAVYDLGQYAAKEMIKIFKVLFLYLLREPATFEILSFYLLEKTFRFIDTYARYYDFCMAQNIKISVDRDEHNPYSIAERIAVKKSGGVSVGYQQANCPIPNVDSGLTADIIFLFGQYYYPTFVRGKSSNEAVIFCGFLTDYSFGSTRRRADRVRERIVGNGAKFIICYFDENSEDDRMAVITNKQSEYIYGKLFDLVLTNNEIGLVCSPKNPVSLCDRISNIKGRMDEAVTTGRCVFMNGGIRTNSWPSEAAQASDLAIGSLMGGTTILESLLSGTRSVYLDLDRLYSWPEYKKGKNSIIFNDMNELIAAINKIMDDGQGLHGLGDPSAIEDILNSKDPFRDGKAAFRMGGYIRWLLEEFDNGRSGEEALDSANKKYASRWGRESVLSIK